MGRREEKIRKLGMGREHRKGLLQQLNQLKQLHQTKMKRICQKEAIKLKVVKGGTSGWLGRGLYPCN